MDRAIAVMSPQWALRRQVARRQMDLMSRATSRYIGKAADFDRNTGNPDDARPLALVDRRRLQELVMRDPFARKALNALVNNTVGWGITGAPRKAPKGFIERWQAWVKACDWNNRLDLYGLQELAVRTMFAEGECFVVFRRISLRDAGGGVPLRLQLLDAGMLNEGATTFGGRDVIGGIEADAEGRVVAYHFHLARPGERWSNNRTTRIEAADCIHLFVQERVGQRRGLSAFASIVKRLGDIDESVEAEIVRKNIEACFVALITQGVDEDGRPLGTLEGDAADSPIGLETESLTPGMMGRLRPGENVKFGEPKASGGLNDIVKLALMSAASGAGIMYEHFGDLSNVNYSSYRAGALEFQRSIGRIQFNTLIPVLLDRIAARFTEEAYLAGLERTGRVFTWGWTPPPFESVDPEKEANGQILLMQAGLESRRNITAGRGYDLDQLMVEIAADQAAQQQLGLAFKGDPFTPLASGNAPADPART